VPVILVSIVSSLFQPMPLMRRSEPFDHPDWLFGILLIVRGDVRLSEFCATLLLRSGHRDYGVSFHTVPQPPLPPSSAVP